MVVVAVLYIHIRCEVVVTLSARLSVCVLTQRMQRYYLDAELTSMLSPDDRPDDSAAQVTLTAPRLLFPSHIRLLPLVLLLLSVTLGLDCL